MTEMMKRCLSLGYSLSVVFFAGRRKSTATFETSPSPVKAPLSMPLPSAKVAPEPPPSSTYSGTVVRDGTRFALRESDGTLFALDSTGRAWPFEGEEVTVMGYFSPESRLLHICAIEAIDDLRAEAV